MVFRFGRDVRLELVAAAVCVFGAARLYPALQIPPRFDSFLWLLIGGILIGWCIERNAHPIRFRLLQAFSLSLMSIWLIVNGTSLVADCIVGTFLAFLAFGVFHDIRASILARGSTPAGGPGLTDPR
jgi:hypothetical protein